MSYKLEQTIKEEYFQRIIKLIHSDQGINRIGNSMLFSQKSEARIRRTYYRIQFCCIGCMYFHNCNSF